MVFPSKIIGDTVELRAVECGDAPFIVQIRNDTLARYLHAVEASVVTQEQWIEEQRKRAGDYYFVMLDKAGNRIGTVGLSNIEGDCGETSRFISYGTPVQNTEANLLITDFAFDTVGLQRIEGYVSADNIGVISLQKKFGYVFEDAIKEKDGMKIRYAKLLAEDYRAKRPKLQRAVEAAAALSR